MGLIILFVLLLLIFGAAPWHSYSRPYGFYPAGGLGLLFVIILVLVLLGHVPYWF